MTQVTLLGKPELNSVRQLISPPLSGVRDKNPTGRQIDVAMVEPTGQVGGQIDVALKSE